MRFLVDTRTFLWAILSPEKLTDRVKSVFADREAEILVSIATPWEMAIKAGMGKLENGAKILDDFEDRLTSCGYRVIETSIEHAIRSGCLPRYHKDPFDRLLIAQAITESLPILTHDAAFAPYPVKVLW